MALKYLETTMNLAEAASVCDYSSTRRQDTMMEDRQRDRTDMMHSYPQDESSNIDSRWITSSLLDQTHADAQVKHSMASEMVKTVHSMISLDRPLREQLISNALKIRREELASPLSRENVDFIVKYADGTHVFDAYARSGENGQLLRDAGMTVFSVEEEGSSTFFYGWPMHKTFEHVSTESPIALIKHYPFKNLLLATQAHEKDAVEVVRGFRGTTLFYVGNCANFRYLDAFFSLIEQEWELIDVQAKDSPTSDISRIYVFRRNKQGGTLMPRYAFANAYLYHLMNDSPPRKFKQRFISAALDYDRLLTALTEAQSWWTRYTSQPRCYYLTADDILPSSLAEIQAQGNYPRERIVLDVFVPHRNCPHMVICSSSEAHTEEEEYQSMQ